MSARLRRTNCSRSSAGIWDRLPVLRPPMGPIHPSPAQVSCPAALVIGNPIQPVAMNADGSANSCANPAKYGSTVSFFMHGVGGDTFGFQPPQQLGLNVEALVGYCPTTVTNAWLINNFVYKVDVTMR